MCPAIGVTGYLKERGRDATFPWSRFVRNCQTQIHPQADIELIIAMAGEFAIIRRKARNARNPRSLAGNGKADREIIKLSFQREGDLSVHRVPIRVFDNRCEYHRDVVPFRFVFANSCYRDIFPVLSTKYRFEQKFNDSKRLKRIEYACFLAMPQCYEIKR